MIFKRVRQQNAQRLKRILSRHSFIKIPEIYPDSSPSFLRFPIIIEDKPGTDRLFRLLSRAGIGVSRSYTRTLPEIFSNQGTDIQKRFPGAQTLADCLLTLPVHHLTDSDLARIESVFKKNLSN
jgi:dTDP-4-amino-4,6-dideoxygalactose transaminase